MFYMKDVLREIKNLSAHSTALPHQGLVYVVALKAGISPDFDFFFIPALLIAWLCTKVGKLTLDWIFRE